MKKKLLFSFLFALISFSLLKSQVGINTQTPQGVLDVVSTNSAVLLTRISNPATNVGSNSRAGMILYDPTNKTIRYFDGTMWNTMIYSDTNTVPNEGVVNITGGTANAKPTYTFTGGGGGNLNTFLVVTYTLPLTYFTEVTNWPENIVSPTDGNIYVAGKFIENTIIGQANRWRIVVNYSGKTNGSDAQVTARLKNNISNFTLQDTKLAFKNGTSGVLVFEFTTIGNSTSLPTPFGTGNGLELTLSSDTAITLSVDSVTRISATKD